MSSFSAGESKHSDCIVLQHTSKVVSVSWGPDNKIVSGTTNGVVCVWDARTHNLLWSSKRGEGHVGEYTNPDVFSVSFSPDGKHIVSGAADESVCVWDAMTGKLLHTLNVPEYGVNSVSFSPLGKKILSGSESGSVKMWDWDAVDKEWYETYTDIPDPYLGAQVHGIRCVIFSPNGKYILECRNNKTMRMRDLENNISLGLSGDSPSDRYIQTDYTILSASFSPDGKRIVSGSDDSIVRVWEAKVWGDGDVLLVLEGHEGRVRSVSWNPKGDAIASGSDDKTVRVWDATYGYCLHTLTAHESKVMSVSWSPNGDQFVSGSLDKTVRIWDVPVARKKRKYINNTDTKDTLQVPFVEPPSDEICIICMDAFDIKSIATHGYAVRLECGHFFHRSCIKQWQKPGETEVDPLEYEEGVTYSQSGYQMPGTKCPVCREIAKNMFPDGILRLRF